MTAAEKSILLELCSAAGLFIEDEIWGYAAGTDGSSMGIPRWEVTILGNSFRHYEAAMAYVRMVGIAGED